MAESKSSNVPLYDNGKGRRCPQCGRTHAGRRVECNDCWRLQNAPGEPSDSDELVGGRWVRSGLTQRWVAA